MSMMLEKCVPATGKESVDQSLGNHTHLAIAPAEDCESSPFGDSDGEHGQQHAEGTRIRHVELRDVQAGARVVPAGPWIVDVGPMRTPCHRYARDSPPNFNDAHTALALVVRQEQGQLLRLPLVEDISPRRLEEGAQLFSSDVSDGLHWMTEKSTDCASRNTPSFRSQHSMVNPVVALLLAMGALTRYSYV